MSIQPQYHGSVTDELTHLRSQNDQLWKIIEKQRLMIQNLQKDNARLATERDGIADRLADLEREMGRKTRQRAASILISPEMLREIAEAEDATSMSESALSPVDLSHSNPTLPPRSPYRSVKESNATQVSMTGAMASSNHGSPTFASPEHGQAAHHHQQPHASPITIAVSDSQSPPGSPRRPASPASKFNSLLTKDSPQPTKWGQPAPPVIPSWSKSSPIVTTGSPRSDNHTVRGSSRPASPAHDRGTPPSSFSSSLHIPPSHNKRNSTIINGQLIQDGPNPTRTTVSPKQPMQAVNVPIIQEPTTTRDDSAFGNLTNLGIKVVGSKIKVNDKGKEVISFTISVGRKRAADDGLDELWRVEKYYSDFLGLDTKLKAQRHQESLGWANKLPDKALFTTRAPSKVDVRKAALEQYLQHIVSQPWKDMSEICEFLSSNVIENQKPKPHGRKEGYLTKRGKNFGGWKSRYFILNGPTMEYYESKDGNQLGSIRLTNAQIGRQSPGVTPAADDSNNLYRHAFLIVEQKRPGSSHVVRHILCAESDEDRDAWVEAIFQNITFDDDPPPELRKEDRLKTKKTPGKGDRFNSSAMHEYPVPPLPVATEASNAMGVAANTSPTPSASTDSTTSSLLSTSASTTMPWTSADLQGRVSVDQLPSQGRRLHTPPPMMTRRSSMINLGTPSDDTNADPVPIVTLSPTPGQSTDDLLVGGATDKKSKHKANRMTFWGKKVFSSTSDLTTSASTHATPSPSFTSPKPSASLSATTDYRSSAAPASGFRHFLSRSSNESSSDRSSSHRKQSEESASRPVVFGVPLEEAVRTSGISDSYPLPAVVYRCIEYLDAKNAVLEEGLYRLSGSNTVMKNLKQKFNQEYDVNLLASKEDYDIHAVAGLLKMWLRELPTSVLTRELRMDFLHVIDLLDRKDRVNELGRLVSQLPLANYTLLRVLTAHLIRVVQHADINKMTMRNVSIVFSPTLGIPAMIFNLFMSEFEYIFWTTEQGDAAPRRMEEPSTGVSEASAPAENSSVTADTVSPQAEQEALTNNVTKPLGRKPTLKLREEFGRSNRNSVNYMDGAPHAIVDMEKNIDGATAVLDEEDEEVDELSLASSRDDISGENVNNQHNV